MNKESPERPDMLMSGGFVIGSKNVTPCLEKAVSEAILTSAVSDKVSAKDTLAVVANFSLETAIKVSLLRFATLTWCVIRGSASL